MSGVIVEGLEVMRGTAQRKGKQRERMLIVGLVATLALNLWVSDVLAKDKSSDEDAVGMPIQMGDMRKSCDQLIGEAQSLEEIMGGAPQGIGGEQLASIGTDLAMRGALRAGSAQAMGAVGQVGNMFGRMSRSKKEKQAKERAAAEKRWYYVVGLYQGRQCDAQVPGAETPDA